MNAFSFLPGLFAVAIAALAPAAPATRPNVLLICVDDLKPLLGAYGNRTIKSPHIDRLAGSGLLFERAYTNQAVCAPSRNALMTGLRPTTLGIYDLGTNFRRAAPDAITVAQLFKQHGWHTEGIGKTLHQGHGNSEDAASWSVPHWRPSGGLYARTDSRPAAPNARGPAIENAEVPDSAYTDGMVADEAIQRLQAARERRDQPFFLAVGFVKPHLPFTAPKPYWDLYDRAQFELPTLDAPPAGAPAYARTNWGELRNYRDIPAQGALPPEQARELIHGYHASVSFMDAQVGRVVDALDRLGLAENTIVVLWGDHGFHLGDHGQWCKHTNYEQANHIPLVIRAPGTTRAGTRTQALVETVDIYPTLGELAGLPAPRQPHALDGESLVGVLRDPNRRVRSAAYHAYPRNRPGEGPIIGRALRTDRHRLVEWKKPGAPAETAELELYDYVSDPAESQNLAPAQPEVVARLRQQLATFPEARPQLK